ncbi:hypothetical protein FIC_00922 [Flavobacteriaceae bacterium 3519-10]|nr:hypothetical protein FIC_00922 [Flavobacteriaceae bacterium 3519-10]
MSKEKTMKNIFIAAFAAAAMFSCSSLSTSRVGSSQASIANTKWTLADDVSGKKPTLNIESGRITGNGGCNSYFGELTVDPTAGNFSAKNVGSTKMACDNMSVESNFFSMLNEATKYVVSGNTLELYKGNLLLLKFNKL